jgi:hypothetical protein
MNGVRAYSELMVQVRVRINKTFDKVKPDDREVLNQNTAIIQRKNLIISQPFFRQNNQ